jgi:hypothetical protein
MRNFILFFFCSFFLLNYAQEEDTVFIFNEDFVVLPLSTYEDFVAENHVDKVSAIQNFEVADEKSFFWWLLLALFALSVVVWNVERQYSLHLIRSVFSLNHSLQIIRTERFKDRIMGVLYAIVFIAIVSIAAEYFALFFFSVNIEWYQFALLLTVFNIVENIIAKTGGFILNKENIARASIYNKQALRFVSLLIIIPLIFLSVFSVFWIQKVSSFLIVLIFVLFFVVKEFRNFQLMAGDRINVISLYFFLYLCTFKILPILFVVKILYAYMLSVA